MPLSGKELIKLLHANGWRLERIKGSHHIMARGSERLTVPVHANKSLGKGLEARLLKKAGLRK